MAISDNDERRVIHERTNPLDQCFVQPLRLRLKILVAVVLNGAVEIDNLKVVAQRERDEIIGRSNFSYFGGFRILFAKGFSNQAIKIRR